MAMYLLHFLKVRIPNLKQVIFFFNSCAASLSLLLKCCLLLLHVGTKEKKEYVCIKAIGSSSLNPGFVLLLVGLQCILQPELHRPSYIPSYIAISVATLNGYVLKTF